MASPSGGQFVFSNGSQTVHLALSQNGSVPTATKAGTDLNIEVFVNPGTTVLPALAAGFDAGVIVTDSVNGVAVTGSTSQELLGGQNLTLFTGAYEVTDNSSDTVMSFHQPVTIQGGSGNQTLVGASGDTILAGSGASVIQAVAGRQAVTLGGGAATVFGGSKDSVLGGTGNAIIIGGQTGSVAGGGSMSITVGTSGAETIYGSLNPSGSGLGADTLTGGAASAYVDGLGAGDQVNFANQSGSSTINASFGNVSITLGSGTSTVFGGTADTVTFGSGNQYFSDDAGAATITLGSKGTDTVYGSSKAGAADTITAGQGSAANLLYNPGSTLASGEIINLAQSTGANTVQAFKVGSTDFASKDTITAGSGSDSIFAGGGSRVGVGTATQAGGTHAWFDSDSTTGAVSFGTNDTVAGTKYGATAGATTATGAAGSSTATVTVGGFGASDSIFYASRSTTNLDSSIIATAQSNGTSTTIVLPDGTTMTLVGVTSAAGLKFTS